MKFLVTLVIVIGLVTVMMGAFGDLDKLCQTKAGRIVAVAFWIVAVTGGVWSAYLQ